MKIEKQVVSLELAKELKSLGFPQRGVWWWFNKYRKVEYGHINPREDDGSHWEIRQLGEIVAPTVGEFLEILPDNIEVHKYHGEYNCIALEVETNKLIYSLWSDTAANALAKMVIYGIKNKLWEFKDGGLITI